jgi:hypothetical protein
MVKVVENFATFTGVAKKALEASFAPPSVNSIVPPAMTDFAFNCIPEFAVKPALKSMEVELMVYVAEAVPLSVYPLASATALSVMLAFTAMVPLYKVDPVVGVLPSVVK